MTDLTPDHPAVEVGGERFRAEMMGPNWTGSWASLGEQAKRNWRIRALGVLKHAIPRLTADDLRDTPAGRALMAEAWGEATLWIRYRDGRWPQDMEDANPYEEAPDDRP